MDSANLGRTLMAEARPTSAAAATLGVLRLADPADHAEVSELREASYRNAVEFAIHASTYVGWCALDDRSAVATAWQGSELVSTLRATVADDAEAAADILTCTVDLRADAFPAVVLTKAATRSGRRAGGLHSVLRYYCLEAAARQGLHSALGLVYTSAPRLRTMAYLGYTLRPPDQVWDPEGPAITQPLFAVLRSDHFEHARSRLASAFASALADYPWSGTPLAMPVNPRVH